MSLNFKRLTGTTPDQILTLEDVSSIPELGTFVADVATEFQGTKVPSSDECLARRLYIAADHCSTVFIAQDRSIEEGGLVQLLVIHRQTRQAFAIKASFTEWMCRFRIPYADAPAAAHAASMVVSAYA